MSERLQAIEDAGQIQSGIVKSLHVVQAPLWVDGQNVVFEDGTVRKSPGYQKVVGGTDGTSAITGIHAAVVDNGNPEFLAGDSTKLYRWNGAALSVDGTGYSGVVTHDAWQDGMLDAVQDNAFQVNAANTAAIWDMESFGSWVIATNGVDAIQIDKMEGAGAVPLGGSPPTTANCLVRFANQLLAFDLTGHNADGTPYTYEFFAFSDIDGPEQWVSSGTNAAGYETIRDMDSNIVAVERLGAYVAAYSSDAMALVTSLGAPLYFGAQKIFDGLGAASKHAVVPVGFYNYGICSKGIWQTDGTSFSYISPPYMRRWLTENVNFVGYGYKIAGVQNQDRSLIEWGVPTFAGGGDNDVTILFNYDTGAWSYRSYGITAGFGKGIFPFPLFGLKTGNIYFSEIGVDADGVAISAFVQTKPFPCIVPKPNPTGNYYNPSMLLNWKVIEQLLVAMRKVTGTVTVSVGVQDSLKAAISWSTPMVVDESLEALFPEDRIEGKWISLKITSSGLGDDWTFAGAEIYGSFNGSEL